MKKTFFRKLSQSQRIGLGFAIGLMIGVLVVLFLVFVRQQPNTELFLLNKDVLPSAVARSASSGKEISLTPDMFDPNTLTEEQGVQMGLSPGQIKNILNYRKAGGHFRVKSDVRKLYSMDSTTYAQLYPYINLPEKLEQQQPKAHPTREKKNLFAFDPNTISLEEGLEMGLTEKQMRQMLNYRNKGGCFRTKSDMQKLYFMNDSLYQQIYPFLLLPDSLPTFADQRDSAEAVPEVWIDINRCDEKQLQQLKGIGTILSSRIINYRSHLGGFYTTEQLLEVKGIKQENYDSFVRFLTVDTALISPLRVNSASLEELQSHPYLDYYLAKSIVTYRKRTGFFTSEKELEALPLMTTEIMRKLRPYIVLDIDS